MIPATPHYGAGTQTRSTASRSSGAPAATTDRPRDRRPGNGRSHRRSAMRDPTEAQEGRRSRVLGWPPGSSLRTRCRERLRRPRTAGLLNWKVSIFFLFMCLIFIEGYFCTSIPAFELITDQPLSFSVIN